MTQEKIKVGVIMGGMSSEKEVSLESGRNIYNKMPRERFFPIPIFMDSTGALWEIPLKLLMRNSTKDIEDTLKEDATPIPYESLKSKVDVVFLGLHGKYGEDGCIQGLLELLNIPYTGSGVLASAIGMNKFYTREILAYDNIDVPLTVPVDQQQWEKDREYYLKEVTGKVSFPAIVKPAREGCSTAVKKVQNREELERAVNDALLWDNTALVEEFIEGTEVTCGVLGYEPPLALTPSETIPTAEILTLEDKFLYGQGENKTPARLPEEILSRIKEVAVRTFQSLGLSCYARIDMIVRKNGQVVVLEANTQPGMTPSTVLFHQAAMEGITQADLIGRIIDLALQAHAKKRGPL